MIVYLGTIDTQDLGSSEQPRYHHNVRLKSLLTLDESSQYEHAEQSLFSVRAHAHLFAILVWNFEDFIRGVANHLSAYATKDAHALASRPPQLDINRLALNFLSSMRTYLDHLETSIAKRHGPESVNLANFRQYCSDAYDSHFSYRFLYRLRNYAQHCGLPIGQITFTTQPSEDDPRTPVHRLSVAVLRDTALRDFDWGPLKEELAAQEPSVDFPSHITNAMPVLERINSHVIADELPTLTESAQRICDLAERAQSERGEPCIFHFEKSVVSDDEPKRLTIDNLNFRHIPLDMAKAIVKSGYDAVATTPEPSSTIH